MGDQTASSLEGPAIATIERLLRDLGELAGAQLTLLPAGGAAAADAGAETRQLADGRLLTARPTDGRQGPPLAQLLAYAAATVEQRSGAEDEVRALTDELLERYEEVTLLHELARDLVGVFDEAQACLTVLARARIAIAADYGEVFLAGADGALRPVAGTADGAGGLGPLAARLTAAARGRTSPLLLHRAELFEGEPLPEAMLCLPLRATTATSSEDAFLGALVMAGRSGDRFTAGEAALGATVARQLAAALESDRLVLQLREKERIEREVELAADIQRQLLPARSPLLPGVALRAACLPAERVGGDYYDFVVGEDSVTVVVADVSGHGIGPGLMMAMTRTALRHELQGGGPLGPAVARVNRMMWDDLLATGLFITLFVLRYDFPTRRVSFVNGGHHPALWRRSDGTVEELDADGYPLGLLPDADYEEPVRVVAPGESVVLFTDGIVEERAPDGTMFGTAQLVAMLAERAGPAVEDVLAAVEQWRAGGPQQDDVTLVQLHATTDEPRP